MWGGCGGRDLLKHRLEDIRNGCRGDTSDGVGTPSIDLCAIEVGPISLF